MKIVNLIKNLTMERFGNFPLDHKTEHPTRASLLDKIAGSRKYCSKLC